jgi:hypothetical protein
MAKEKAENQPAAFDPYDIHLKKELNALADEKNFVFERKGRKYLACGAKKPKKGKNAKCGQFAGAGTAHVGYGRCKHCGGNNTGPRSKEAKEKVRTNGIKHGFYSRVLNSRERDAYHELREGKALGVEEEIYMMKAKILNYLEQKAAQKQGRGKDQVIYYTEGETKGAYRAGTIEDRPLERALNTLRRLVDSHAKLTNDTTNNMLDQINGELRAASQGQVEISWKGKPTTRQGGESHGSEEGADT